MSNNVYDFYIDGLDVSRYLLDYPQTPNSKSNLGELVELQNLSFQLNNINNSWTPESSDFLLHPLGDPEPVIFIKNGDIVYTGLTRSVSLSSRGKIANLTTTSKLNQILNSSLPPTIYSQLTLSEISQKLYNSYGVATNQRSYLRSKRKQEEKAIQATTNIILSQNLSMLSAQQFLSNAGLCYHYFVNEVAFMEYYDFDAPFNPPSFYDIDILNFENYEKIEKSNYDGYSINTAAGLAYQAGNNLVPVIEADQTKSFVINTVEAGLNIGDALISISQKDQWKIKLSLQRNQWSEALDLSSFFKIDSNVTGINQIFYCIYLDFSQPLEVKVEGLTVL